jgi:NCS1 family nucleobase:cation symporter-1
MQVKDLYTAKKTGPYYYTLGIHWRGYAAYFAGILINIVGFVGAVTAPTGGPEVPVGAQYLYQLNFFCGFIISSSVYWTLCKLFPVPATSDTWQEVGDLIEDPSLADGSESEAYDEEVMGKSKIAEEERYHREPSEVV